MVIPPPVRPERVTKFLKPYVLRMHFTNKYVNAQVVHTPTATVAAAASTQEKGLRLGMIEAKENTRDVAAAAKIGKLLGERLRVKGVPAVSIFFKRDQRYHGKVKAVIDSIRGEGIELLRGRPILAKIAAIGRRPTPKPDFSNHGGSSKVKVYSGFSHLGKCILSQLINLHVASLEIQDSSLNSNDCFGKRDIFGSQTTKKGIETSNCTRKLFSTKIFSTNLKAVCSLSRSTRARNDVEEDILWKSSKRLIKLAKRWQKFAAIRRKRISFPSLYDDADSCSTSSALYKGHFTIYTADQKRFVVPLSYLENEIIRQLLSMSEEEFGLPSDGPITLPCDAVFMEYIISLLSRGLSRELESALLVSVTSHRCSSAPLHQEGWRNLELLVC
nr:auxin-responsive protein SAUR68-like [Ipomoea batatas]